MAVHGASPGYMCIVPVWSTGSMEWWISGPETRPTRSEGTRLPAAKRVLETINFWPGGKLNTPGY
jgi:hypothetical protein